MEQAPNMSSEVGKNLGLSPEEVARKNKVENATNRAQFAIVLAELKADQKLTLIVGGIEDEEQLIQLCIKHPEIEQKVAEILGSIGVPFRKMVDEHPEVLYNLLNQKGSDYHFPLTEIDLSEVRKYLPNYSVALH